MNELSRFASKAYFSRLAGFALLLTLIGGGNTWAQEFPLAPNPNPYGNTIVVGDGQIGVHEVDTFTNFGSIQIQNGGAVRNLGEMDIIADEDNGGGSPSFIIAEGGRLETGNGSQMNFDSLANFSVSGTVVNAGNISTDWSCQFFGTSVFENQGSYQNKQSAIFRGEIVNSGFFGNVAQPLGNSGYLQQITTSFANLEGGEINNQGHWRNFTTIDNAGVILNDAAGSGGQSLGRFDNLTSGRVNNLSTGVVTNRERWFNDGRIDNAGLFINHFSSLGMSNSSTAVFNNLTGGQLMVDRVINSQGQITNAGYISIVGDQSIASGIRGGGTFIQTGGITSVDSILQASNILFEAGVLEGNGVVEGLIDIREPALISPGHSVGALDLFGDVSLSGTFLAELETAGLYDTIHVSGNLVLGESSTLEISLLNGYLPGTGERFDLVTAGGITGEFETVVLPDAIANRYRVAYLHDSLGNVTTVQLTAIPEPALWLVACFFGVMTVTLRRNCVPAKAAAFAGSDQHARGRYRCGLMLTAAIGLIVLVPQRASADLITEAQLIDVLGDDELLEDFEGVSVAGGTYVGAPNPLNSLTANPTWGIEPGVTYSSPDWMRLYANSLFGDDSNLLAGGSVVRIAFDQPQRAVGLWNKNFTGNLDYELTATFYRGQMVLASYDYVLPSSDNVRFWGYEDSLGITEIRFQATTGWAIVDHLRWGVAVSIPEPGIEQGLVWCLSMTLVALNGGRRRQCLALSHVCDTGQ